MTDHTPLPPEATPSPQEAQRVSPEERIPSTYEGVNQEATAGPSNFARPSGTITAGESSERSLRETLQKTKELEIRLRQAHQDYQEQLQGQLGEAQTPQTRSGLEGGTPHYAVTSEKPKFRTKEPDEYHGDSLRNCNRFIRQCETKFRLDPKRYSNEYDQTLIASTFMRGTVESSWTRYEKKLTTPLKFSELKTWLVDQVQDPTNRGMDYNQRYHDAKQREGQSVVQFVNYLEELEDNIPYSDL